MPDASSRERMAILPLRAGSKGLPGKNTISLAGKPLYRHTLDQALRTIGKCIVSTDIAELLGMPPQTGCQFVRRPAHLATDKTPMEPVLSHLFGELDDTNCLPDLAILLQATSPLRRDKDILDAIALYEKGSFDLVMSVTRTDSGILKYGTLKNGIFEAVSHQEYCFENRQDLPKVVRPNGAVYVFSPRKFLQQNGFPTDRIGAVEMPTSCSIDIDCVAGLNAAERAMHHTSLVDQ